MKKMEYLLEVLPKYPWAPDFDEESEQPVIRQEHGREDKPPVPALPIEKKTMNPLPLQQETKMRHFTPSAKQKQTNISEALLAVQEKLKTLEDGLARLKSAPRPLVKPTSARQDPVLVEQAHQRWEGGVTSWPEYCAELQQAGGKSWQVSESGERTNEENLQRFLGIGRL